MKNRCKSMMTMLLLITVATATAQVKVGVKAGASSASLGEVQINHYAAGLDNMLGFHAGVMLQFLTRSHWGVETGLYYSLQGGKEKEIDYDESYEVKATAHYLQLPVQAIYKFRLADELHLYPAVGLYFAYGLGGTLKGSGTATEDRRQAFDLTYNDDFFNHERNKFDMGLAVGLNLQYQRYLFGVSCDYGFLKINKKDIIYEDDNTRNENIKVSIGVLF
ncbi:MAG: PorT family protein [Prevotellaceae bacterium]|jgi:hypothetical protein|nr:PorT family protein [Prevotellaceae bacterium]